MRRERDPLAVGQVIGDVIDPFIREVSLRVYYNDRQVINVGELRPSLAVNPPSIEITGAHPGSFHTLVMVDPDAPSPGSPREREYLHWLVSNIPAVGGANHGQEIVSYESPRPSMGIHRYVFVVFRQLGRQTMYGPGWRQNFNTREFAATHDLGSPVAAIYFNSQREGNYGGRRR